MIKVFFEIIHCLKRLAGILKRRQIWSLALALVLIIISGVLTNIPAVVLGRLLDYFVEADRIKFSYALSYPLIIFCVILVRETVQVCRKYIVENTCTRVEKDVRVSLINHLLRVDLAFFADKQVGSLHGRLNRSIEGLVKLIKLSFLDFLPSLFIAFFALAVAFYRAPILLGVGMALVVPIGIWIVLKQVASQKGIRIDLLRGKEEIDGTVVELLGGLENVRALHSENFETARVEVVAERLRAKEIVHHLWMAGYDAVKYVNEGFFHVFVLASSILLAANGSITTGDILTYSLLFMGVVTPLREIHRILDEAHESSIRVQDFFSFVDLPTDRSYIIEPNYDLSPVCSGVPQQSILVTRLSYTYTGAVVPALNDINLKINNGDFVGICGPAGCGKSTLLKILLNLCHFDKGSVSLLGRDICQIQRGELADLIGYVSQTPFLVSGTIYENIAYNMKDVTLEEVENAARKANIHDEIMQMPNDYYTLVGERGANLSGGQRQRVALARIFLRSPSIIILDEATSAMDNLNEKAVQKALERVMEGKTVLAVAHRLTTLWNADKIFVMENGQIKESGTYQTLLNNGGLFSRLARAANERQGDSALSLAA